MHLLQLDYKWQNWQSNTKFQPVNNRPFRVESWEAKSRIHNINLINKSYHSIPFEVRVFWHSVKNGKHELHDAWSCEYILDQNFTLWNITRCPHWNAPVLEKHISTADGAFGINEMRSHTVTHISLPLRRLWTIITAYSTSIRFPKIKPI